MTLVGRNLECKQLTELVDEAGDRGGALLIRGEAGIGKSALLAEAGASSSAAGRRVLTAIGSEAEQHLPFASLHQVLYPIRDGIDALPAPQRDALRGALGLADAAVPTVYLVGLATLNLLAETAAGGPLVLLVDDAHWLDRSSAEVLAFVARRLESEPILLVATVRDDARSPLEEAGLRSMLLVRLPEDAAGELLDTVAPNLVPAVRSRLLREAAGNPLALTELPASARNLDDGALIVPLTDRLERAFAARVAGLPATTRNCLLIAALNDSDSVAETLTAASADVTALVPAVDAGLVELRQGVVRFRHPLMRSAVAGTADPGERWDAYRVLAESLRGQPDRQAWHRAAATAGPAEDVAAELAAAADRAQRRGGVHAAMAALERAARLSGRPDRRVERLLRAAELAVEAGRRDVVERLVREAEASGLSARQRANATWLVSAFDDGIRDGSGAVALATLAESVADGHVDLATQILWGAGMRCFWIEPGPDARQVLLAVADRLLPDERDPRTVAISAYLAPIERAAPVLTGLRALAGTTGTDPQTDRFLGSAALQVGAFDLAARFSAAAVPGLRAQGRLGLVTRALGVQAWSCVRVGDLATALPAAIETGRLAQETEQPYLVGFAQAIQAEIAALRRHHGQATELAREAERVGLAAAARPVLATAQRARALAALGEGRHGDAFADLRRMFDPMDPTYQLALRCYVLPELVDAAVRCDRSEELRDLVVELEDFAPSTPSPALHIGLRYARAVLAQGDHAEELFTAALDADLTGWPLDRGRVRLAFGEWLRRRRRVVEAREQLRTARDTFDALGATLWGERARQELRTAGEASPRRGPDARDRLTPHELSIARLAAEGLTNREIGQRLYLSHRTVSTHLHRIFPKLGVSSRTELAAVLRSTMDYLE
jgi:DNA-binding CsgD family transcriptional regulator